jgi:toxin ParE1/3/4
MRIKLHPAARRELHLALDWYLAEAGPSIAARFVDEFEHLKTLIQQSPEIGVPGKGGSRRMIFRHFPYTLVYRLHGEEIQLVALAHQSRQPDYWVDRL